VPIDVVSEMASRQTDQAFALPSPSHGTQLGSAALHFEHYGGAYLGQDQGTD
jgi:hypothetical protein